MDTLKDKFFSIYAEVFDEKENPKTVEGVNVQS